MHNAYRWFDPLLSNETLIFIVLQCIVEPWVTHFFELEMEAFETEDDEADDDMMPETNHRTKQKMSRLAWGVPFKRTFRRWLLYRIYCYFKHSKWQVRQLGSVLPEKSIFQFWWISNLPIYGIHLGNIGISFISEKVKKKELATLIRSEAVNFYRHLYKFNLMQAEKKRYKTKDFFFAKKRT